MRTIHAHHHLQPDEEYRLVRDGLTLDIIRLHLRDGATGWITRGRHEHLERVDLRDLVDEYHVAEPDDMPTPHEHPTDRAWDANA